MALRFFMDVHTASLRAQGIDVLTAQEDGSRQFNDQDLLDRATHLGRVLFSQDKDFLLEAAERQASGAFFAGVVFSEQILGVGICIRDLTLMGELMDPQEMHNRLEYLPLSQG